MPVSQRHAMKGTGDVEACRKHYYPFHWFEVIHRLEPQAAMGHTRPHSNGL